MMRRPPHRILAAAVVLLLALLGAACGGGSDTEAPEAGHVNVVDNRFEPSTIEIQPGDTVTWDFQGAVQHNVVGEDFESEIKRSGTFEHTFNSAGSYDYRCTLHPGMNGTVQVG